MSNLRTALLAALLALGPAAAVAEPTPAAPAIQLGGLVDSYYSLNLNAPQTTPSPLVGFTGAPGLRLSYAELNGSLDAGVGGLRVDLGYGPTSSGTTNIFVQQAYATAKVGPATVDFGRFVTSAGAEVIEAKDNWLYTRSILFSYAIPFAHTGVRVGIPVADGFTLQLGLLNGWDDDVGGAADLSPHKTFNASLFYSKGDSLAALNVYTGKEPTATGLKTLVDVVLQQGFGKLALNLNFDYGTEDEVLAGGDAASWWGLSLMARYAVSDALRLSVRGEIFDDPDGYRLGTVDTTYYEGTVGLAYALGTNVELRGELRYDMASEDVFVVNDPPGDGFATFQISALAWF